jgi:hypothetical protein
MGFKLVISNSVDVDVKFTVQDAGTKQTFTFTLQAERLPAEAFKNLADTEEDRTVAEFLADKVTGWKNQRLVVNDNGTPVEFSREALEVMLSLAGLAGLVFSAYVKACGAQGKEKN